MIIGWPDIRPDLPAQNPIPSWHPHITRAGLSQFVTPSTFEYLELGTWLGASAKIVHELGIGTDITCIDAFDGRGGGQYDSTVAKTVLKQCIANLWDQRQHTTLIRDTTIRGIEFLSYQGYRPDLIFIDADHSTAGCKADIVACMDVWPNAQICGDDYPEVMHAVIDVLGSSHEVADDGIFWWRK